MKGTVYQGKGMIKHDPLTLLTAADTVDWMKTKVINGRTIYSRWLLPEAGLNETIHVDGKPTSRFGGPRPPGNLPQTVSLDEFANKLLMDCVNRHISATKRLERGPDVTVDPKYEFCDTVRASRAVLRC